MIKRDDLSKDIPAMLTCYVAMRETVIPLNESKARRLLIMAEDDGSGERRVPRREAIKIIRGLILPHNALCYLTESPCHAHRHHNP